METVELENVRILIRTRSTWLCRIAGREVWIRREEIFNRAEWEGGPPLRSGRLVIPRQRAHELKLL